MGKINRSNSSNVTVSLTRCDDISFHKSRSSKGSDESQKTIEVKRSLRISRKRTIQDEFDRDDNQSHKNKKITKKRKYNQTKLEKPKANKSSIKKSNNKVSNSLKITKNALTNYDFRKMSDIQHSLSTVVNSMTLPVKTASKTIKIKIPKNISKVCNTNKNDCSEIEFVQQSRKRGRPLSTAKTNGVVTCVNKIDKQKTKNPDIIIDNNINKFAESSEMPNDDKITLLESNNKTSDVGKKRNRENSSVYVVKLNESCSAKDAGPSETELTATSSEDSSDSEAIAIEEPRSHLRTFERDIYLLSKRFNIPLKTLRNVIVKEPLSVFREKFSKSITPSMLTVSPIVDMIDGITSKDDHEKDNLNINYKVEPIRESEAYEKTNLKDCINQLSKTMPSWSLCTVHNPPRYVISQMSINTFNGNPVVSKSIVLDRFFRASVYVNQCLQYKYCKYYNTATEIVNLIKDLNTL